jgi:DNA-binding GntR family transcriptional regulator
VHDDELETGRSEAGHAGQLVLSPLATLRDHSLTDVIQQEIEKLLFTDELRPGDRINEKQLAERLGVSRAPVREATRALQEMGLVELIKNRGVFVRTVNVKQVVDIFNIRGQLAELAASEAARRITDSAAQLLASLIERMHGAATAEEYLPLNLEFHRRIFLLSDNERLASLDLSLGKEVWLFRLRGLRSKGSIQTSQEEHRMILESLRARNSELAGRLFSQHILAGRDRFLATIDKQNAPVMPARPRARKAAA